MDRRTIIRLIEAQGWVRVRITGSHHHFHHADRPGITTVPHPTKDVTGNTLRSIEKAVGRCSKEAAMKRSYLGAVSSDGGSYGIVLRDFPGCVSAGDTLDEVLDMGREALSGHIAAMLDDGEAVPEPTDHDPASVIDRLRDDDDDKAIESGWIGLLPIEAEVSGRAGLITIRMRAELVRKIADMADERSQKLDSRAFIERAVEHDIDAYRKSAA